MANVHWDNIFLDIARHWITNKESDDIKAYHDIACDYDIAILRNNLTEDEFNYFMSCRGDEYDLPRKTRVEHGQV